MELAAVLRIGCILMVAVLAALPSVAAEPQRIDFNRDIRPILSDKCFRCHGPDESNRQADLRLDTFEGATAKIGDLAPIQPGSAAQSSIVHRMMTSDESEKMPPPDSGLKVSGAEIDRIRHWIDAGAKYEVHWAFRPIAVPPFPPLAPTEGIARPADFFILDKLQTARLSPSPEADRATLLRRIHLDLLGLPPSIDAQATFLDDSQPDAIDRLVDRQLANPHFGERWGRHWLDQARYADTNGYTVDSERSIWPYRDWVIAAINRDLPFDQFTIEQLAGDLLPNATRDQLVATGFHRNTLVNQEGGTDAEQFRNEAVVDRVNTTGAVWLGLTVGCSQCHNHKYDPISQREYYELFAFFNSGQDVNSVTPTVRIGAEDQENKLARLTESAARAKKALADYDRKKKEQATKEQTTKEASGEVQPDSEREKLAAAAKKEEAARADYEKRIPSTMVMRDVKEPRATHLLIRGDFLRRGEPVKPGTPRFLPAPTHSEAPRNRLDLAQWLVDGRNPLVARVLVNRAWMRFFGDGLVETENDFGMQGTPPTHPELLDWLAAEFMQRGWSQKRLFREILLSSTYRQSSRNRSELVAADPRNKLLARQNRLRVEAEIVRDLALAASGLLAERMGGPGVYPPQPAGVYAFTQRSATWTASQGEDRYRRGMYTFFMRSVPYPMLTTFDTPRFDAVCTRRIRSNTPLQSLTMSNDETMIEFARALAKRILEAPADSDAARLEYGYRCCLGRAPDAAESERLVRFVQEQRIEFQQAVEDAAKLAGSDWPASQPIFENAAWVAVARVLVNLDEFITRE